MAEKTAVAAGYALTSRLRYGNVFLLLRLRFEGGGAPCSCRIPHACSWDLKCIIVAPSQSFLLRSFARHGAIKVAIQVIKSVSSTLNRTLFFSKSALAAKYPSMRFRWTLTHDI